MSLGVPEGVSQQFECNSISFFPNDWRERSPLALNRQTECRHILIRLRFGQLTSRSCQQLRQSILGNDVGTYVANRIAAFGDCLLGPVKTGIEDLHRAFRTGRKKVTCRLILKQQSLQTLEQSIMELASDTGSFTHPCFDGRVEFPPKLPDAQLVGRPEQRQKEARAESAKPIRLVIRRSDEEIRLGGAFAPDAVAIRCDHAEVILAGRQIRVKRLPTRTGIVPVTVIAVETVAKFHFQRNRKRR